jgi:hypothetical protein
MAFICAACAKKIDMPILGLNSYGRCEDCGKAAGCADVPTSHQLPYWKKFVEKEEAAKKANWGVFEAWLEKDTAELHVVPMVDFGDGKKVMSAAHVLDPECRCGAIWHINEHGVKVWSHHDPDHIGALTDEGWAARKGRK